MTGVFVGDSAGGSLTFTIATDHLVNRLPGLKSLLSAPEVTESFDVTGLMKHEEGDTVSLLGFYDRSTHRITFSGGGVDFAGGLELGLHMAPAWFSGRFSGNQGAGVFVGLLGTPPATRAYCGVFQSDSTSTTGRWNFVVHGDSLVGFAAAKDWGFDLGFYSMLDGAGEFRGIAGAVDSTRQATFYWLGTVNSAAGSASGTWIGFFNPGLVREDGTWSAEAHSQ